MGWINPSSSHVPSAVPMSPGPPWAPHPCSWPCSSSSLGTSGADFPCKATLASGMPKPLRESRRERWKQPEGWLRMWWLDQEESGAGGGQRQEKPERAKASLAVALGTGLRGAGSMSCGMRALHELSPTCLQRGRKRGNLSVPIFSSRITFPQAFPEDP